MSVCTGIFVLAESGVLEREQATGPRGLLGELRAKWPNVKWVERRWCHSENERVWCSGMYMPYVPTLSLILEL